MKPKQDQNKAKRGMEGDGKGGSRVLSVVTIMASDKPCEVGHQNRPWAEFVCADGSQCWLPIGYHCDPKTVHEMVRSSLLADRLKERREDKTGGRTTVVP